ncbi:hypothetical protein BIZ82_gp007 [Erwinia phage vB_EamM_EarlPhillipIV]|nr:hypothetical protein BIZ82_gp007 [Erwinia phage vB_EamM_EarlPhillipIV]ANZ48857.1 hypothetical protein EARLPHILLIPIV_7 [Erwinia phage vB_EamM_EarlPhillipIV]QXO09728.1 hypothetical protein pEaSNUABM38_00006 [Erwinia phage pEa_SNUABM_38]
MGRKISPVDVVRLHPDDLANIKPKSELDKKFLTGIEWGFALHPDEVRNTQQPSLKGPVEIDWRTTAGHEDVVEAINAVTVSSEDLPIAGPAEHLISLRRFINAQAEVVRNGEAWQLGTALHLKSVFGG